jgi:hypothetical protein
LFAAKNCNSKKAALSFVFRHLVWSEGISFPILYSLLALKNGEIKALTGYFRGVISGIAFFLANSLFD